MLLHDKFFILHNPTQATYTKNATGAFMAIFHRFFATYGLAVVHLKKEFLIETCL